MRQGAGTAPPHRYHVAVKGVTCSHHPLSNVKGLTRGLTFLPSSASWIASGGDHIPPHTTGGRGFARYSKGKSG